MSATPLYVAAEEPDCVSCREAEARRADARRWTDAIWGERSGFFFFAFGVGGHFSESGKYEFASWQERSGRWPDDRDRFLTEAIERGAEEDVYVAPLLRSNASRKKGSALPSNILYADDDVVDAAREGFESLLIGPGGVLIGSGNGRHVYLALPEEIGPAELEHWNRRLAATLGADAGWAENKVLRLPGTYNHKGRAQGGDSVPVRVLEFEHAPRDWTLAELDELLDEIPTSNGNGARGVLVPMLPDTIPPLIKERLGDEPGDDRSAQVFAFIGKCLRDGLSEAETLALGISYPPAIQKYGNRVEHEIRRAIEKLRGEIPDATTPAAEKNEGGSNRIEWHRLSEVEMRSIVFIDKPLLQAAAFHLLTGRKGQGKGTLLSLIAAGVTQGKLGDRRNVVWIGSEDSASIDIKPRLVAAGGDPERVLVVKRGWIQLPLDVETISMAITEMGEVGMVVIDPVGNHITGKDSNSETDIRAAIAPLNQLADDHNCMVFGVRHLSEKECTRGVLAAILGSSAWVQVPRAVLAVARDPEDPQVSHIQCVAGNRLPAGTPGRMFRISGVMLPGLENEVTRADWSGDSTKDVETMLGAPANREPSKSATARELILNILEGVDQVESDTLDARVSDETGIAAKTVKNLRSKLKDEGLIRVFPEKAADGVVLRWHVARTKAPRNPDPEPHISVAS